MLVILAMSTLSLISLSIKDATDRASKETFANITNSFSMEINRQVNPGTPRGGGNVKGEDIKKISQTDSIDSIEKLFVILANVSFEALSVASLRDKLIKLKIDIDKITNIIINDFKLFLVT